MKRKNNRMGKITEQNRTYFISQTNREQRLMLRLHLTTIYIVFLFSIDFIFVFTYVAGNLMLNSTS